MTSTDRPHGLRVEHLDEPLGLVAGAPAVLAAAGRRTDRQFAYRVRPTTAGTPDGARRAEHPGPLRRPGAGLAQRVEWQVQVWTDLGESDWSEPAWFETRAAAAGDWSAGWVEPGPGSRRRPAGARPAALLRREFDIGAAGGGRPAVATAQGIYEAFLNGARVGDPELTPGFTQYAIAAAGADLRRRRDCCARAPTRSA